MANDPGHNLIVEISFLDILNFEQFTFATKMKNRDLGHFPFNIIVNILIFELPDIYGPKCHNREFLALNAEKTPLRFWP